VKNILIILLLAGLPLWAQTPAFAPLPPDPASASRGTNANNQQLQEMLRRTLVGGTNAPAGAGLTSSSNAAAANVIVPGLPPEAVAPAGRGTNRSQRIRAAHRSATNAVPVGAVGQPVKAAAGAGLPALPAAVPVPQPPAGPVGTGLNAPTGSISPVAGMPAAPAPPPGAVPSAAPGATGAAAEEMLPQGMIDFRAADLNQVLDIYSDMVKRTVLRPATLPAPTITLTTKGQLTMREGIQALEAVLALNGITMVNMGDKFVKALPEAQGNTAGARFDTNNAANLPELGQYVTHVVQLKYAKPSEMTTVLQPFLKIPNAVLPIDSAQILVLRDYTENIKRMLELIERIDVAVPSEFVSEVIPIKYAKASEIASALNSLSSGGGGTTVGASSTGTSRTSRMTGMNRTSGTTGTYPGQTTTSGMVTPPGSAASTPTAAGSSFSQRLQNIINRASQQGEIQVLGQTKIISDERTNSLLIYAAKEDMKTVKDIVAKLDVVLAQVLIEAVIMSVTLTDSRDLGISYLQRQQTSGKWSGVGAINNKNMFDSSSFNLGTSNGLPQGFSYLTSWGSDLDVVVTALAANGQARILQRPRIQTSHNEMATLFVGQSRPYPTSSYYGGGAYGGYSSIQQLQIGEYPP